jgi:hypothetical protein
VKRFSTTMIIIFMMSALLPYHAAEARKVPSQTKASWLLVEDEGDIFALEVTHDSVGENQINLTGTPDQIETLPFWNNDGLGITFVIAETAFSSWGTFPTGRIGWMTFDQDFGNRQVRTLPLCNRRDVSCTNAQAYGEYLVYIAISQSGKVPTLYIFNTDTGNNEVFQIGGFDALDSENGFRGQDYIYQLSINDNGSHEGKMIDVRDGTYEPLSYILNSERSGACELVFVFGSGQGLLVRFDQESDTYPVRGWPSQNRPWRLCSSY